MEPATRGVPGDQHQEATDHFLKIKKYFNDCGTYDILLDFYNDLCEHRPENPVEFLKQKIEEMDPEVKRNKKKDIKVMQNSLNTILETQKQNNNTDAKEKESVPLIVADTQILEGVFLPKKF